LVQIELLKNTINYCKVNQSYMYYINMKEFLNIMVCINRIMLLIVGNNKDNNNDEAS